MNTFGETLFCHSNVELVTIKQLTDWFQCDGSGRLRLPAIQRSLVWRNEQIVNYWDSVMRGYPPGTMLVTQATNGSEPQSGHGANGKTEEMCAGDFQLFDGQQRLAALLLGLGKGPLRRDRRLWIDIGSAKGSGDRLFDIRINSTGQPFGSQSGKPNEKLPAHDRQKQWLAEGEDPRSPDKIFDAFSGQQVAALATARCAVSLSFILDQLLKTGREATKNSLRALLSCHAAGEKGVYLDELLACLGKATEARLIVNLLEDAVLRKDNYARFFVRLGQGVHGCPMTS